MFLSLARNVTKNLYGNTRLASASKCSNNKVLIPLTNRRIIKVSGVDSEEFLQGLITNDMHHLQEAKSMFAMFLNSKGRVLYDTIVAKSKESNTFLLECDASLVESLMSNLNLFKLKRAVEIKTLDNLKLWALLSSDSKKKNLESNENIELETYDDSKIETYDDPRLPELGSRIISELKTEQVVDVLGKNIKIGESDIYKYKRYTNGVVEGCDDIPTGISFPLELNCDYLHGVSFHKGCYLGQEVTARVHHTGVVRKRIMPLKFNKDIASLKINTPIFTADNTNIGKLRGIIKDQGIGLVRIKEALKAKTVIVGDYEAQVIKPEWWPIEAPKEIKSVTQNITTEQT